jgi:hypothetical protein
MMFVKSLVITSLEFMFLSDYLTVSCSPCGSTMYDCNVLCFHFQC